MGRIEGHQIVTKQKARAFRKPVEPSEAPGQVSTLKDERLVGVAAHRGEAMDPRVSGSDLKIDRNAAAREL
jgi:hypothetical protein